MKDDHKPEEIEQKPETETAKPEAPENAELEGNGATEGEQALTDKHGEPAVNMGHHRRIVAEKDAKIAELERQLGEERTQHNLLLMGCIDTRSAMFRLDEFDGDLEALKKACPHLFGTTKMGGSTGLVPRGTTSDLDDKIDRAFNHSR